MLSQVKFNILSVQLPKFYKHSGLEITTSKERIAHPSLPTTITSHLHNVIQAHFVRCHDAHINEWQRGMLMYSGDFMSENGVLASQPGALRVEAKRPG